MRNKAPWKLSQSNPSADSFGCTTVPSHIRKGNAYRTKSPPLKPSNKSPQIPNFSPTHKMTCNFILLEYNIWYTISYNPTVTWSIPTLQSNPRFCSKASWESISSKAFSCPCGLPPKLRSNDTQRWLLSCKRGHRRLRNLYIYIDINNSDRSNFQRQHVSTSCHSQHDQHVNISMRSRTETNLNRSSIHQASLSQQRARRRSKAPQAQAGREPLQQAIHSVNRWICHWEILGKLADSWSR